MVRGMNGASRTPNHILRSFQDIIEIRIRNDPSLLRSPFSGPDANFNPSLSGVGSVRPSSGGLLSARECSESDSVANPPVVIL
jgi:hypothetical protein